MIGKVKHQTTLTEVEMLETKTNASKIKIATNVFLSGRGIL